MTISTRRTRIIDVKPAEVMASPWGRLKGVRVVHSDGTLYVVSSTETRKIEADKPQRQRGVWTTHSVDDEPITFRRAGGCACGKPWLKGPTSKIIDE